jgi:hypothetical protein
VYQFVYQFARYRKQQQCGLKLQSKGVEMENTAQRSAQQPRLQWLLHFLKNPKSGSLHQKMRQRESQKGRRPAIKYPDPQSIRQRSGIPRPANRANFMNPDFSANLLRSPNSG